jgi:hypothetical protein
MEEINIPPLLLIFGPMVFGNTTTELNRILEKYKRRGLKVIKIVHSIYNTNTFIKPNWLSDKVNVFYYGSLTDITIIDDDIQVIGIDRGHLFDESLYDFVIKQMNLGKKLIVASLHGLSSKDLTTTRQGFMFNLIPHCTNISTSLEITDNGSQRLEYETYSRTK